MPDIQLPNGKIIRNVPDGTTREQVKAKVIAAGLATEADFAPRVEPTAPALYEETQTSAQKLASQQDPFSAFAISMGRGLENFGRGVEKAAKSGFMGAFGGGIPGVVPSGAVRDKNSVEERAYAALQEQRPYSTMAGEVVGETLPALPAGLAAGALQQTAGRVGATALLGAAETSLAAAGRDESASEIARAGGVGGAVAGVAEAAIPYFGRIIGQTYRRLTGETVEKVLDANGNVAPQVQRVLEANGVNIDEIKSKAVNLVIENPENLEEATRMGRFRQQEIPYTPGDITQDFKQKAKEARLSEIQEEFADPLRDLRINQAKRIDELRTELAESLGKYSDEATGQLTKQGLELSESLAKGEVRAKYNKLAKAAGYDGGMPLPVDPIQSVFDSQSVQGMIRRLSPDELNKIQKSLIEYGIETDEQLIESYLKSGSGGLTGKKVSITPLSTENSEKFVQALNSVIDQNSSNELRGLVGNIKGAVDQSFDMLDSDIGSELVSLAKDARLSNVAYKQEFSPKALATRLIRLNNDRVTPLVESSRVYASLFGRAAPIEQQRKTLELLRRTERGKQAIKSLQANMIMDVFDAGFLPSSRMNGQMMFNGNSAKRYMSKIGDDVINELFKDNPKALDDFMSLLQTGVDITPSGKEIVKGSGSVILNLTNQLAEMTMANKLPLVGDFLSIITRAVRSGADEQEIQKLISRSPKLKKQYKFIQEQLPHFGQAMGLVSATAVAKDEDKDDTTN